MVSCGYHELTGFIVIADDDSINLLGSCLTRNPWGWSWNNCRCEIDRHTSGAGLGDLLGTSSRQNPSQPQLWDLNPFWRPSLKPRLLEEKENSAMMIRPLNWNRSTSLILLILGYSSEKTMTHTVSQPWLIREKEIFNNMYMSLKSGWAAKWRANRLSFRCLVELDVPSFKIHCGRAAMQCKL